ncbi:hydroxyacylglutathione hydrolase [Chitinimonas sp. BJYL2]|uniref:hydroxyacylglutathione hydrolase n=1 Tax=Chitinimonas sp. BJYL2 TaxID=2976696 RepID=UPI0022B5B61C|nr:hydroxyacylglutathione hydrolase [Chitinimonas sp. BJYL2]
MTILPVPILDDNYVWLMHDGIHALVVDPGDAAPVKSVLAAHGLTLTAILITHHHRDHIGGVADLQAIWSCPVYGPPGIDGVSVPRGDGDRVELAAPACCFEVLAVPGHTLDHLAYYDASLAILFCGDTLFACGCGRLFEGTPQQMQTSLARLAALPAQTQVYCTHEYTLSNQRFALAVEPDNATLQARHQRDLGRRQRGEATLPTTLAEELACNPFLRWAAPVVKTQAARQGAEDDSPVAVFAAIRRWKDQFKA